MNSRMSVSALNSSGASELRKEFEQMELLSPDVFMEPNYIKNKESDDDGIYLDENTERLPMFSQDQKQKSKPTVKFADNLINNLNMVGGKHDPNPYKVTDENAAEIQVYLTYCRSKLNKNFVGKERLDGTDWPFGKDLLAIQNPLIQSVAITLGSISCYVCLGSGHCQNSCLTFNKVKKIGAGIPFISKVIKLCKLAITDDQAVKDVFASNDTGQWPWLYMFQKLAVKAISKEERKYQKGMQLILQSVLHEYKQLNSRCLYCNGIGHFAIDTFRTMEKHQVGQTLTTPIGKKTKFDEFKVKVSNKVYQDKKMSCPTKVKFETLLAAHPMALAEAQKIFNTVKEKQKPGDFNSYLDMLNQQPANDVISMDAQSMFGITFDFTQPSQVRSNQGQQSRIGQESEIDTFSEFEDFKMPDVSQISEESKVNLSGFIKAFNKVYRGTQDRQRKASPEKISRRILKTSDRGLLVAASITQKIANSSELKTFPNLLCVNPEVVNGKLVVHNKKDLIRDLAIFISYQYDSFDGYVVNKEIFQNQSAETKKRLFRFLESSDLRGAQEIMFKTTKDFYSALILTSQLPETFPDWENLLTLGFSDKLSAVIVRPETQSLALVKMSIGFISINGHIPTGDIDTIELAVPAAPSNV